MLKGGTNTVQGRRKQIDIDAGKCIEARSAESSALRAEKIFTFIIQSSGLALVQLCALHALLTGRLSLSDVLELAILWALLIVTVML